LYDRDNKINNVIDNRIKDYIKKEKNFTEEEFNKFEQKVPELLKALKILKINKDIYYKSIYKNMRYKKYLGEDKELKSNLNKLNGIKVICSNSCEKHVKGVLKCLNVLESFDEICCTDKFSSKLEIYNYYLKKYNLPVNRIYLVGNDYLTDIKPARSIGLNTIYINKNSKIKNIEDAIKILRNEEENDEYE
jgi:FMN phosphatase YigB (HAD superfamily)